MNRFRSPAWLGTVRRTRPLSDHWGADRGQAVDRYYIERFLERHRQDIRGRVLEVCDSRYTDRFGIDVHRSDVLDIDASNPRATVVVDLSGAEGIEDNQFDCFIVSQTLHLIYDFPSAVRHAYRILRPGGVILATLPSVSRIDRTAGLGCDYWRFTAASSQRLFGEIFTPQQITVESHGNVLTNVAFLLGMAREELSSGEMNAVDPYFPLIICVRAVKG